MITLSGFHCTDIKSQVTVQQGKSLVSACVIAFSDDTIKEWKAVMKKSIFKEVVKMVYGKTVNIDFFR